MKYVGKAFGDLWDQPTILEAVISKTCNREGSRHYTWFIVGDFNEVLHPTYEIGGTPFSIDKTQRMNECLNYSKSIDRVVQGRFFTWKKFLLGDLMYEKLNRVIFRDDCE